MELPHPEEAVDGSFPKPGQLVRLRYNPEPYFTRSIYTRHEDNILGWLYENVPSDSVLLFLGLVQEKLALYDGVSGKPVGYRQTWIAQFLMGETVVFWHHVVLDRLKTYIRSHCIALGEHPIYTTVE